MFIADPFSRFTTYFRRNGLRPTIARATLAIRRALFANRTVVFSWDLEKPIDSGTSALPAHLSIECRERRESISPEDWDKIIGYWNPAISGLLFSGRLEQDASLWLIRSKGKLAGYAWSIVGRTLEPYFFPLSRNDAYLYDFLVFPEYRGQRLIGFLVSHVLQQMAATWCTRAYVDVAEWNQASLSATQHMGFERQQLGIARKLTLFGKTFVRWS